MSHIFTNTLHTIHFNLSMRQYFKNNCFNISAWYIQTNSVWWMLYPFEMCKSANIRINTYEKVHLVGLFIQFIVISVNANLIVWKLFIGSQLPCCQHKTYACVIVRLKEKYVMQFSAVMCVLNLILATAFGFVHFHFTWITYSNRQACALFSVVDKGLL